MSLFQEIKDIFIPQAKKSSAQQNLKHCSVQTEVDHETKEVSYVDESRKPSFARKLGIYSPGRG